MPRIAKPQHPPSPADPDVAAETKTAAEEVAEEYARELERGYTPSKPRPGAKGRPLWTKPSTGQPEALAPIPPKTPTAMDARIKFSNVLGITAGQVEALPEFVPYLKEVKTFYDARVAEMVQMFDHVGVGVSQMVCEAAWDRAWSQYLFAQAAVTGNLAYIKVAGSIAAQARQSLMTAHELAKAEREARKQLDAPFDPLAIFAEAEPK